jgi:hypothetical protein
VVGGRIVGFFVGLSGWSFVVGRKITRNCDISGRLDSYTGGCDIDTV